MRKLFGLPAHPLFVHAPLVLLPLVTLLAVVAFIRPNWRRMLALPLCVGAVVAFVATFLAGQSGESLAEAMKGLAPIKEHEELADVTRLLTAVFAVLSIGHFVVARRGHRRVANGPGSDGGPGLSADRLGQVLAGAACLVGILGTIWMIRTGHEGARVVWDGTIK